MIVLKMRWTVLVNQYLFSCNQVSFYQRWKGYFFQNKQLMVVWCISLAYEKDKFHVDKFKVQLLPTSFFREKHVADIRFFFNKKWYKHPKNNLTMLEFVDKWLDIHVRDVTADY